MLGLNDRECKSESMITMYTKNRLTPGPGQDSSKLEKISLVPRLNSNVFFFLLNHVKTHLAKWAENRFRWRDFYNLHTQGCYRSTKENIGLQVANRAGLEWVRPLRRAGRGGKGGFGGGWGTCVFLEQNIRWNRVEFLFKAFCKRKKKVLFTGLFPGPGGTRITPGDTGFSRKKIRK